MATSLTERVTSILEDSDFNDLPYDERVKIGKYMAEQQILTIWQTLVNHTEHTTEAWRKKQRAWLKSCVEIYMREHNEDYKRGLIE